MERVLAGTIGPFDPSAPGLCNDPYPTYARYRASDPVHWIPGRNGARGRWAVFGHVDASHVLRGGAFGRGEPGAPPQPAARGPNAAYFAMISRWMLFSDRPRHARRRAVFTEALAELGEQHLRRRVKAIAERLVSALPGTGPFDLISDFAFALPVLVVADLVGLPERDSDRFRAWSSDLTAAIGLDPRPNVLADAQRTAREMRGYLRELLEARRHRPALDLLSLLAARTDPADEEAVEDVVANCAFLMLAGHETTTHLIASGVLSLHGRPDQMSLLRARPELGTTAVEELLRFESPVQITSRIAQEDTQLGGRTIRARDHVDVVLGSANRDSTVFAAPDRIDIGRSPNPHLAFGAGGHYCVGATLARLEGAIALPLLLERFPTLRIVEPEPCWRANAAFRGLERLRVIA